MSIPFPHSISVIAASVSDGAVVAGGKNRTDGPCLFLVLFLGPEKSRMWHWHMFLLDEEPVLPYFPQTRWNSPLKWVLGLVFGRFNVGDNCRLREIQAVE
jgi:hypothetical protein